MYNYQCSECGAYLDPGENCDCTKKGKAPTASTVEAKVYKAIERGTSSATPYKRIISQSERKHKSKIKYTIKGCSRAEPNNT